MGAPASPTRSAPDLATVDEHPASRIEHVEAERRHLILHPHLAIIPAMHDAVTLALLTEVFPGPDGPPRLTERLREAVAGGAAIALLPELPLDRWAPATREAADGDAEPPRGPRWAAQREAARTADVALVGGAIVHDPETGGRHNTAFVFDREGRMRGEYRKAHLPSEEGFWEADHYQPGDAFAEPVLGLPLPIGVQICSDANRPAGSHVLAALGAELIVVPRATPAASWERWKLVLRAIAVTSCAFVATINRPGPEAGVPIGGPSALFGPDGSVLHESCEPLAVTTVDRTAVEDARRHYPGYLPVRHELYADAWASLRSRSRPLRHRR